MNKFLLSVSLKNKIYSSIASLKNKIYLTSVTTIFGVYKEWFCSEADFSWSTDQVFMSGGKL